MNPIRKARKTSFYSSPMVEPIYLAGEGGYEYPFEEEYGYNEESEY